MSPDEVNTYVLLKYGSESNAFDHYVDCINDMPDEETAILEEWLAYDEQWSLRKKKLLGLIDEIVDIMDEN